MRDVVICEPIRTAVGRYGGVFRDVPATELAAAIVRELIGSVPKVSNIKFFSECLKIVNAVNPEDLHEMILQQLKKRTPQEAQALESTELPRELKHICLCINPTKQEYNNLFAFLNHNL